MDHTAPNPSKLGPQGHLARIHIPLLLPTGRIDQSEALAQWGQPAQSLVWAWREPTVSLDCACGWPLLTTTAPSGQTPMVGEAVTGCTCNTDAQTAQGSVAPCQPDAFRTVPLLGSQDSAYQPNISEAAPPFITAWTKTSTLAGVPLCLCGSLNATLLPASTLESTLHSHTHTLGCWSSGHHLNHTIAY